MVFIALRVVWTSCSRCEPWMAHYGQIGELQSKQK